MVVGCAHAPHRSDRRAGSLVEDSAHLSELIRHPDHCFITVARESAESPGLINLAAEAQDEEIILRQPQDQAGGQVIVHGPAEQRAIVIDRIDRQKDERQERALEIDGARRYSADRFPVAHLVRLMTTLKSLIL